MLPGSRQLIFRKNVGSTVPRLDDETLKSELYIDEEKLTNLNEKNGLVIEEETQEEEVAAEA